MKNKSRRGLGHILFLSGLLLFLVSSLTFGATIYHVATDGDDAADGLGWETAMLSAEVAVAAAVDGDTIRFGGGTHNITSQWVVVNKAITLTSTNGPSGTALKAAYVTANKKSVLEVSHADARISGLTIRDGNYSGVYDGNRGAGVTLSAGTVSNCVITACTAMVRGAVHLSGGLLTHSEVKDSGAASGGTDREGGGVYMTGGTVAFCDILNNKAPQGGGVCIKGTSAVVRDSRFFGNSINGYGGGGGVFMNGGLVDRCVVATNTSANYGGGIEVQGGLVRNTLVANNTASLGGGGVRIGNANGRLVNLTVADNNVTQSSNGHGLYMTTGIASNLVVHGNGVAPFRYGAGNVYKSGGTLVYSCSTPLQTGTGNIAADPLFAKPEAGNYRLLPGSPCRDASPSAPGVTVNLDGKLRPIDGTGDSTAAFDMGCYEADSPLTGGLTCGFSVTPAEGSDSVTATLTAYVAGADTVVTSYSWNFGDGSPVQSGSELSMVTHTYAPGFYDVTLSVNTATEGSTVTRVEAVRVGASVAYVVPEGGQAIAPYNTWAKAATNIQDAVDIVMASDTAPGTVIVADGTYNIGAFDRIVVQRAINLRSENGPLATAIDGQTVNNRRIMLVNHAKAHVSGFTLKNG